MEIVNYDFDINETNKLSPETGDIDVIAEFAGNDFKAYLASEIVYPPRAYKYLVQGKVYVQFMINVDGSLSNPIVVRGLDKDLDKEALRIIRNIPDWKPARKDGEPVLMTYTCPVVFTIKE